MITLANKRQATRQDQFLTFLPIIKRFVSRAFRHLDQESRIEAVSDIVASTFVAYTRLVERGQVHLAFPTVLARFGVIQYLSGRRAGTRTNTLDVTSPAAQRKHKFGLCSLSAQDRNDDDWKTIAVEDHSSTPADIAAFRVDFEDWNQSLKPRYRRIAADLGIGHSTSDVAKKHQLSPGRISQIRKTLEASWAEFHEPSRRKETINNPNKEFFNA